MFSGNKNRFKADLKFSMLFGSVFWIAALVLYLFVFAYIFNMLRQETKTGIEVRLLGYWAIEKSEGLDALRSSIDVSYINSGESQFFVRIADELNNTVLLEIPKHWSSFNFEMLERNPPVPGSLVELHSPGLRYKLEAGTIQTSDGYYLQVGMSDENRRRILELLTGSFTVALLVLVGVSFVLGFVLSNRFLLPVRLLGKTVSDVIETGRIESRVRQPARAGELNELVISFNLMLQRIEDLVTGMKGALDTVAHDLRTPLTRFRITAEKVLSEGNSGGYRAALEQAMEESETLLRMMTMLMDISEAETGTLKLNLSSFNPAEMIRQAAEIYSIVAEEKNITINTGPEALETRLQADRDRFMQAVGNLLDNAVKYGKEGGEINIASAERNGELIITVSDNGEGISREDLPGIWERLYRGRSSRDGLGLGLSLVNAIVKAHGGRTGVVSEPGEGSVFTIVFPLGDRA